MMTNLRAVPVVLLFFISIKTCWLDFHNSNKFVSALHKNCAYLSWKYFHFANETA